MPASQTYNEQELLSRISKEDELAFKILFEVHYPAVYKAALLVTGNPFLAEEVVQDVFLTLWLKRKALTSVGNITAYLFIIARNRAYKALQKQVKWRELNQPFTVEESALTDMEEHLEAEKMATIFEAAIRELPPRQQQVYQLSKQRHMTREQVAAALGISPETVKKQLSSAVMNIRAYCQSQAPELLKGISVLLMIRQL